MKAENETDNVRSEFLLKMYLSTDKNTEEMKNHLVEFKEQSENKLILFNLFYKELSNIIEMHHNHRQILYVLDLGIRQANLYIEWSKEMLESLQKANE